MATRSNSAGAATLPCSSNARPAQATQRHGGTCDKCGVDFAKYGAMLVAQEQTRVSSEREKQVEKAAIWKQIILLPITGGYSLIRFFLSRSRA